MRREVPARGVSAGVALKHTPGLPAYPRPRRRMRAHHMRHADSDHESELPEPTFVPTATVAQGWLPHPRWNRSAHIHIHIHTHAHIIAYNLDSDLPYSRHLQVGSRTTNFEPNRNLNPL